MTLVVGCGAGCGIITAGLGAATDSHWTVGSGGASISIETLDGEKWFKFVPAATHPFLYRTCIATRSVGYERVYFRQNGNPTALTAILRWFGTGTDGRVFMGTDGVLGAKWGAGGTPVFGPSIPADTKFGVEVEFDGSVNPHVLKWRVWLSSTGWVDQTNVTVSEAAIVVERLEFGMCETEHQTSGAYVLDATDVIIGEGTTPGEHYSGTPNGGTVTEWLPDADGVHSFTAGDFVYSGGGGNVAVGATDVHTYLDDADMSSIADYISQAVIRTTGYVAVGFEDPTEVLVPLAVAITSTHHASGTTANEMGIRVSDDDWAHETIVWSANDVSDTTAHFRHKVLATKPSGGAWTRDAIKSLQARLGYSGAVAGGNPYFDSIRLGVLWTETADITFQQLYPDADTAEGGWTTAPLWSKVDEVSADGTVITATAS